MRAYPFPLAAILALAFALPSGAAQQAGATQGNQNQPKKVWTNDDLDQLSIQGLISIVGQEVPVAATQPAAVAPATAESAAPVYNSRLEDPEWYAEKAADLQAELDKRQAALDAAQTALAQAVDGITEPGLAMDKPTIGVTPQAAIDILQAQVDEVQNQIDDLSDLARENGIPPGVLRV
jgi:hypothetical protein